MSERERIEHLYDDAAVGFRDCCLGNDDPKKKKLWKERMKWLDKKLKELGES